MKKFQKKQVYGAIALVAAMAVALTSLKLLVHEFPDKTYFVPTYVAYSVAVLILVHSFFFYVNLELKDMRGKGLSKNVPRYIDYCITLLIGVGLVQITFSQDIFARYIGQISGTRAEIVENIRSTAETHLFKDCPERKGLVVDICEKLKLENCSQNEGFTPGFCRKVHGIVATSDLDEYVSKTLRKDSEFLNHPIRYYVTQQGAVAVRTPIASYVNQHTALIDYGIAPLNPERKDTWSWLALVLLPIVLSFRATKTSLELYGELS